MLRVGLRAARGALGLLALVILVIQLLGAEQSTSLIQPEVVSAEPVHRNVLASIADLDPSVPRFYSVGADFHDFRAELASACLARASFLGRGVAAVSSGMMRPARIRKRSLAASISAALILAS
jgi:hypothetical protein